MDSLSGYENVNYYPNGNIKSMTPTIETEWKVGALLFTSEPDREIEFYENGQVRKIFISHQQELFINGTKARLKENSELEFYEDSTIKSFVIDKQRRGLFFRTDTWIFNGKTYQPGEQIRF